MCLLFHCLQSPQVPTTKKSLNNKGKIDNNLAAKKLDHGHTATKKLQLQPGDTLTQKLQLQPGDRLIQKLQLQPGAG